MASREFKANPVPCDETTLCRRCQMAERCNISHLCNKISNNHHQNLQPTHFASSLSSSLHYNLGFWSSMAEDMQFDQSIQSPNTVMPSTPLQLSGFLSGDTIEVKGDTGNLKFSVQFSVQKKHTPDHQNHSLLNSLDANACYPENHFSENSSFSSFMTPNAVQEVKDHQSASCTQPSRGNEVIESTETRNIVTRLRSGVISPVNYFPPISSGRSLMRPCCGGSEKSRKKNRGKLDVFERVLRRHSSPIKPCTSYSFFVMATWGVVKSSTFGETSKQLGRMWCQLPQTEKRLYEEMAMKDNARYKMQCMQLMGKPLRVLQKGRRSG